MRIDRLTPAQHGLGAAAAHLGLLAAGAAVICAVFNAGAETQKLHEQCLAMGNSRGFCDVTYYGR